MRPNDAIKHDVEAELRWKPDIRDAEIKVQVDDAIVTLTGLVDSLHQKVEAESAAKRVIGVAGVANDIQVRLSEDRPSDSAIAAAAVAAIRANLPILADSIMTSVSDGHVTLEGDLEWNFQRERAEEAVRHLPGVRSVSNRIRIKPQAQPLEIKQRIEEAFRRSAEIDANAISVSAEGGDVVLRGKVRSWAERAQAQRTAWSAPGVTSVSNEIVIGV